VTLSIAYVFDFIARTARVVSYIIMHILTYKHARAFEKTYRALVRVIDEISFVRFPYLITSEFRMTSAI
jgi:hypothetical protein